MVSTELAFKVSVLLAKFGQWKMRVMVQLSAFRPLYVMDTELAFKVSVLLAKFERWKMRVVVRLSTFLTLYLMVGTN